MKKVLISAALLVAAAGLLESQPLLSLYSSYVSASEQDPLDEPDPDLDSEPTASGEAPLSDRLVDYKIRVTYDEASKALQAEQTVRWRNPGKLPVRELYFHTYPNAFESPYTTFMNEKRREDPFPQPLTKNARMSILSAKLEDEELCPSGEYVQPDDDNPSDRTLFRLQLPKPVEPGESVTLDMLYTLQMPNLYRRMGAIDDFVMAGQWFPKVAVYETAGQRGRREEGWNLHQYHANSEFYADFGTYDVTVRVPPRYHVAASGSLRQASLQNGERAFRYVGKDIHDFAWAASSDFRLVKEKLTPAEAGKAITLKLYLDTASAPYQERYLRAARKAMKHYAEWFGTYPYRTLSIVVPPPPAARAGSMEYPTLVTVKAVTGEVDLALERVVAHELAHQYFYGLVASNEFEEAWLDESFASYAEDRFMRLEYGRSRMRVPTSRVKKAVQNSWAFTSRFDYEDNVYFRGQMLLDGIAFRLGEENMNAVMRTYVERYRFRHPSTDDFKSVLEEVTQLDWGGYFDGMLYGGDTVKEPMRRRAIEEKSELPVT